MRRLVFKSWSEWVLHEACRQNKAWQEAGLPPINISVNVSARQFVDNNLVAQVAHALKDTGLEAKYLELELTESLIMQDVAQSIRTMRELQGLGVQLSIDDFGTGYSSLSALKMFPVARLKIDKSFIDDLPNNEHDRAVATAVISLGQKLNLRVIAEGVETEGQLAFLRENNCDEMQGYLFSRPVRAQQLEELLSTELVVPDAGSEMACNLKRAAELDRGEPPTESKLVKLIESLPLPVAVLDRSGGTVMCNETFKQNYREEILIFHRCKTRSMSPVRGGGLSAYAIAPTTKPPVARRPSRRPMDRC